MTNNQTPSDIFNKILNVYKNNYMKTEKGTPELEVKFGTRGIKPLTKIDYDNVVKKLKSLGFQIVDQNGINMLRIFVETLDKKTGRYIDSQVRTEITGISSIQEYCKTNNISKIINENGGSSVLFLKKTPYFIQENDTFKKVESANFDDFNFRVSLNSETNMYRKNANIGEIINNWNKIKKSFRYINRISFVHPEMPEIRIDISIIKSSSRVGNKLVKTYTTEESGVFTNPEVYEIEIEVDNYKYKYNEKPAQDLLEKNLRTAIKNVMSGLQNTNYPVSNKEQKDCLTNYMKIIRGKEYNPEKFINNSDFVGPSSQTLQLENIMPLSDNVDNNFNIRKNYVVTDKADGQRCLLFIAEGGKIYLINMNMNVIFTGAVTEVRELYNTIVDGELVLHNKLGQFINLYLAFDLYYVNKEDIRAFQFVPYETKDDKEKEKEKTKTKYRYILLKNLIKKIEAKSVIPNTKCPITISYKKFYPNSADMSIFSACNYILRKIDEGIEYEYNTDGLIFTHALYGVGSDKIGVAGPNKKKTWKYSFKWKPAEFNTIDFLVSTKKGSNGQDLVTPIFEDGNNTMQVNQLNQYKTLSLKCAFDEKSDMFINPCQSIIDDDIPEFEEEGTKKKYSPVPVQFYPTSPYDPNAGICKIMLNEDFNGSLQMTTEDNEVFEDNTIVEFKYDLKREGPWRWVPIRVRYDKTTELKQGLLGIGKPNYGNSYETANNNWKSIHNPVTSDMLRTGAGIPTMLDEDVYYNRNEDLRETSKTVAMRDFHRLYVKNALIMSVSKRGDTLIDYACGKAGDLPRWIKAGLSFVFGVDLFKDNLENQLDGACARYLKKCREFKNVPHALFVNGDSRYNIKSGAAMKNDKAIQITKAVFGQGPRDEKILGKGVFRQYGKGVDGFNVSECQFAIHYFTETLTTLQNFVRNVAETTALNGYFIGTSYDGKLVFELLKNKKVGESVEIVEDGVKVWEIRKMYENDTFLNDSSSLNYQIDVYQESINQMIPEFLVNYDYLNRVMENYGFKLLTRDEAKEIHLPEGSGLFSELFVHMEEEIKRNKYKANDYGKAMYMTPSEKRVSFLNRYFVYKKIRNVDTLKVELENIDETDEQIGLDKKETKHAVKVAKKEVKKTEKIPVKKAVKLNEKLILSPIKEEKEEKEEKNLDTSKKIPTKRKVKKTIIIDED